MKNIFIKKISFTKNLEMTQKIINLDRWGSRKSPMLLGCYFMKWWPSRGQTGVKQGANVNRVQEWSNRGQVGVKKGSNRGQSGGE